MAILEIEIRPEEERKLAQDAEREGLTLIEYTRRQLLHPSLPAQFELAVPIWKRAADIGAGIPADQRTSLPHDGSVNYKHYLYQAPKQVGPEAK